MAYLRALWKHWWALMSSAVFTAIGVYGAWQQKGSGWIVGVSFAAAIALFFVASFKAWNEEHERLLAEIARNHKPEIKGTIAVGFATMSKENFGDPKAKLTDLFVLARLVNHRDVPTTIDGYSIKVGTDRTSIGDARFRVDVKITHDSEYIDPSTRSEGSYVYTAAFPMGVRISSSNPLRKAIAQEGWIRFQFTDGIADAVDPHNEDLTLTVTDSLGGVHVISAPQTKIYFGTYD
jgi:hypothetical protein